MINTVLSEKIIAVIMTDFFFLPARQMARGIVGVAIVTRDANQIP